MIGTPTTRSTDATATTMTATGYVWSSPGAAEAPEEAATGGPVEPPGADTDPLPDAPSTGSLFQVSKQTGHAVKVNTVAVLLHIYLNLKQFSANLEHF